MCAVHWLVGFGPIRNVAEREGADDLASDRLEASTQHTSLRAVDDAQRLDRRFPASENGGNNISLKLVLNDVWRP